MIRLKPLPPIALTDLHPSFYDVESVTAIEMVSKLYAYLQNMVNDYNAFVTEVNNEIEEFEKDTNHNIDKFTCCIKKLMLNYIESIDMKIDLQDNKIQEAIDYMKDNLISTVNQLFSEAIQNGDITATLLETYDPEEESLLLSIVAEGDDN